MFVPFDRDDIDAEFFQRVNIAVNAAAVRFYVIAPQQQVLQARGGEDMIFVRLLHKDLINV